MTDARTHLPLGTLTQAHTLSVPFADLMTHNGMGTQALFGQRFDVISTEKNVAYGALYSVLTGMPRVDYLGTISRTALKEGSFVPTHVVNAISATVFQAADIKSKLLGALPRNSAVQGDIVGEFLKVEYSGYVHLRHLRQVGRATPRSMIDHAVDMIGLPYVWGGTGGIGVDCSGLVQSAFAAIGADAPRDADQQEASLGRSIDFEDRRAGDLLFWPGHVGIVVKQDQLLHANAHHMCVAIESVSEAVARIGSVRTVKRF